MQQKMIIQVLGIKRGEVDGNKYASLYMTSDTPEYTRDVVGLSVMKVPCEYDLLDRINVHDVPGQFNADVALVSAAGGKAGLKVLNLTSMKPKA